jgi:hypothetical protein
MKAILNDFAFRGLLGRHSVAELQQRGLLRMPGVSEQERADHDLMAPVPEAIRTGSLAMQRNYRLLFVFENVIREFISARYAEIDGEAWFDGRASASMKQKVQDRKEKEEKNQWHVGRNSHPIFYLDFGDLGSLITTHWSVFKDFVESQAWVLSRIQEAERTRNVIAHTNVLAQEEAQRLELYLRDWIKQVV